LRQLTDDFGVWQHSLGNDIDRSRGYALDDSARALIAYLEYKDYNRASICLDYIARSQTPKGFIGFYDGDRKALDNQSSDDAHALAFWALAEAINHKFRETDARAILAKTSDTELIQKGYLRTLAYLLLAYSALKDRKKADLLATKLMAHFDPKLGWFEDRLTYANAALPLALLRYRKAFAIADNKLDKLIKQSIDTLEEHSRIGIIPAPVGNRIWQKIGAVERDVYGQQPIDAAFMVLLLAEAAQAYGGSYAKQADDWMQWFYGNNIYKANLIAPNHACADGLNVPSRGVDTNKGAESVIIYLMARFAHQQLPQQTKESQKV
jgi:hypothetical protein